MAEAAAGATPQAAADRGETRGVVAETQLDSSDPSIAARNEDVGENEEAGKVADADEEADEDDDEEEEEEEDEEEEEPLLVYSRLTGELARMVGVEVDPRDPWVGKVTVTCLHVHPQFLLAGTDAGIVMQLDMQGRLLQRSHCHRDAVTALSTDLRGSHYASCAEDGRAVVYQNAGAGGKNDKPAVHNFYHPLGAIQLDPQYGNTREKVFVCGGASGRLVLKKKGWFSMQETEIHRGEGTISNIAWRGRLIAWANDTGVKIYDMGQEQRIAYIDRPTGSHALDACRCHMVWEDDETLLVAWADAVKVVRISSPAGSGSSAGPVARRAELVSLYEFVDSEVICGIAPFGPEHLAILTYVQPTGAGGAGAAEQDSGFIEAAQVAAAAASATALDGSPGEGEERGAGPAAAGAPAGEMEALEDEDEDEDEDANRPELRIITRQDGEEVSIEALPISGFQDNIASDYSLSVNHEHVVGVGGKPVLFIVSPEDVVFAKPRDVEDHIAWALRVGAYGRALALAEKAESDAAAAAAAAATAASAASGGAPPPPAEGHLRTYTLRGLQDKLLGFLLGEGNFEEAARLCPRLLDNDRDRWLQWSAKFENYQTLSSLAGYLPIRNPQLPPIVYESALLELLGKQDYDGLVHIIRQWQTLLYNHAKAQLYLKGLEDIPEQPSGTTTTGPTGAPVGMLGASVADAPPPGEERELIKVQNLYNVKKIIAKAQEVIDKAFGKVPRALRDALAELYGADGQYNLALLEYLEGSAVGGDGQDGGQDGDNKARSDYIFTMIERHGLLGSVQDKVHSLVKLDRDRTMALLVSSISHELGMEEHSAAEEQIFKIVYQLGGRKDGTLAPNGDLESLHKFLHELSTRRSEEYNHERMATLQNMQVQLYTRFDKARLMDFLETASYYSLEKALRVCESHTPEPLYREMVFILGRMGGYDNIQRALATIIEKLRSVETAIEFVEREGGKELWDDLVRWCVQDADLVADLLLSAGAHDVDPVQIMRHLPDDMVVPQLSAKVAKLFGDLRLQQRMRTGCNEILKDDVSALLKGLYRRRRRAVHVRGGASTAGVPVCGICARPFAPGQATPVVIFGSGHSYHRDCIEAAALLLDKEEVDTASPDDLKQATHRHCVLFARRIQATEAS